MIVLLTITPLVAALVLAMVMPSIVRRWTTPKVTRLVPRKQAPPPAIDSHVALAVLVLLYLSACEQKATIRTEECDPAMREQIAAASCGTSLDFRRANALQDRLSDHRDHFVRRWSRSAEDAQVEEIERAARRR